MYDLARIANGSNNSNNDADLSAKSSNMTTFCEVITSEGQMMGYSRKSGEQQQKRKFGAKSSQRSAGLKREQIRCTYEFVVHSLNRKTRYG